MIEYRKSLQREYDLVVEASYPAGVPDLRPRLTEVLRLFGRFLESAGVSLQNDSSEAEPGIGSAVEWTPSGVTLKYSRWSSGDEGLGVLLRMLQHAAPERETATIIVAVKEDRLDELSQAEDVPPSRIAELPFVLEFIPTVTWVNMECHFEGEIPPEATNYLDSLVQLWGDVASLGAFQVPMGIEEENEENELGVGIQGPTVGDDFVQWQCALAGVHPFATEALINLVAEFSSTRFPLTLLYLG